MIVIVVSIGLVSYFNARTIQDELDEISDVRLPSLDYLLQVDRDLQQLLVAERSMIFSEKTSDAFNIFTHCCPVNFF